MEPPTEQMVRFAARGKIFSISLRELMGQPESYLTWLAHSHSGLIRQGRPIEIDKRPEFVQRLLQSYQQ